MPESIFDLQAHLCQTMGNATRLKMLHSLRARPKRVSEIVQETGLAQAKVSQHLAVLRAYGIVAAERRGKGVIYRIANPKIVRVCDLMREVLMEEAAKRSELVQSLQKEA